MNNKPLNLQPQCPNVEIGRQACLRGMCPYGCASSNLVLGTEIEKGFDMYRSLFCFYTLAFRCPIIQHKTSRTAANLSYLRYIPFVKNLLPKIPASGYARYSCVYKEQRYRTAPKKHASPTQLVIRCGNWANMSVQPDARKNLLPKIPASGNARLCKTKYSIYHSFIIYHKILCMRLASTINNRYFVRSINIILIPDAYKIRWLVVCLSLKTLNVKPASTNSCTTCIFARMSYSTDATAAILQPYINRHGHPAHHFREGLHYA